MFLTTSRYGKNVRDMTIITYFNILHLQIDYKKFHFVDFRLILILHEQLNYSFPAASSNGGGPSGRMAS